MAGLGPDIRLIPIRKVKAVPDREPRVRPRPVAVAITGGIGAGKSEALKAFARHGAATISSDDIVHRLLREDADVRAALLDRFGTGILDEAGNVDRRAISRIVFGDAEALAWLERLLHPRVVAEYLAWREQLAASPDPPPVSATEVPLLYEVGGERRFDAVVVITAPPELRRERSRLTSAEHREARLLPDEEKAARADFVYVNDGTRAQLDEFVAGVIEQLAVPA
jgi:dephospho-CoA kinase